MLNSAIRQMILTVPLQKLVRNILRRNGGSLFVPSPDNCFQDSTGTIPCAVDDTVGLLKDLVGNNDFSQTVAGYKPYLRGAVVNYLKYGNDFTNAAWIKANVTASPVAGETIITETVALDAHVFLQNSLKGGLVTLQIKAKQKERAGVSLAFWSAEFNGKDSLSYFADAYVRGAQFDLSSGTIVHKPDYISASINIQPDGYYLLTISYDFLTTTPQGRVYLRNTASAVTNHSYLGDGSSGVYVKEAQAEVGSEVHEYIDTLDAPASSSYGPYKLDFDGVDDRLESLIPMYAYGDSAYSIAVFRWLGRNTQYGTIFAPSCKLTTSIELGSLFINAPALTVGATRVNSRNDAATEVITSSEVSAGHAYHIATSIISPTSQQARSDGINYTPASLPSPPITSNNATIGMRGDAVFFYSGEIYGICSFKSNRESELILVEKYLSKTTGIVA